MTGAGTTILPQGDSGTLTTGGSKGLDRTLQIGGSVNDSGNGSISFDANNDSAGILQILSTGSFTDSGNGSLAVGTSNSGNVITNLGTFIGSSSFNINVPFNSSGTVDVTAGTTSLRGGGTETGAFSVSSSATLGFDGTPTTTFNSGSSLAGAGAAEISTGAVNFTTGTNLASMTSFTAGGGTATFSTGAAVGMPGLTITGGTLSGSDTITIGTLSWTGGTMTGTGTTILPQGDSGTLTSGGTKNLDRILQLSGGITDSGNGPMNFDANGDYPGVLDILSTGTFTTSAGGGIQTSTSSASNSISNLGTFIDSSPSGDTLTIPFAFSNSGTVNVTASTLNVTGTLANYSSQTLTGGTWNIGGVFEFTDTANAIATDAASITLTSSTAKFISETSVNVLTSLSLISSAGSLDLQNGQQLSTSGGITNQGQLIVDATGGASSLTMSANYNQSGGGSTTLVAGGR